MPIFTATLVSFVVPVLGYHRYIFVLPSLYILLSIGILKVKDSLFIPLLIALLSVNLIGSWLYLSDAKFQREDWRGFVEHISQQQGNTQVVFLANAQMEAFDYYNKGSQRVGLENINLESDTLWLVRYLPEMYDPEGNATKQIEDAGFNMVAENNFNGIIVWEYENSN